jgi:hypothetical protein
MGLKGAGSALMLREAAIRLDRPIIAVTALPAEAEALAHEAAFFLGENTQPDAAARKVHLLPAWELKPFAQLSPPTDTQAARLAALYAMRRLKAPLVVASVEALMIRTIPRDIFGDSIVKLAPAERVDLDALVEALASLGYQRVPQVEELGDFSVRGGIVDIFSPLYRDPIRIELDDDLITSIRRFDSDTQRSAAEIPEATVIRARLVPPSSLKDEKVRERVAIRSADIGLVRKEVAELTEALENGILFPGAGLFVFSAWCLGILNSHRRFFLSYTAPVVWNAAMIATLWGFGARYAQFPLAIILSWGSVVGAALMVVIQLPVVLRLLHGLHLRQPLAEALGAAGGVGEEQWRGAARIRALLAHASHPNVAYAWTQDPDVAWLMGVHQHEGVSYVVKEHFEHFLWWMALPRLLEVARASKPDVEKLDLVRDQIRNSIQTVARDGYKVDKLEDAPFLEGTREPEDNLQRKT